MNEPCVCSSWVIKLETTAYIFGIFVGAASVTTLIETNVNLAYTTCRIRWVHSDNVLKTQKRHRTQTQQQCIRHLKTDAAVFQRTSDIFRELVLEGSLDRVGNRQAVNALLHDLENLGFPHLGERLFKEHTHTHTQGFISANKPKSDKKGSRRRKQYMQDKNTVRRTENRAVPRYPWQETLRAGFWFSPTNRTRSQVQ